MEIAYFKRPQVEHTYIYIKVVGGPGKTENGYQEVISFLNEEPIISIEHNDTSSLIGTWCTYEVGELITKDEYKEVYKLATEVDFMLWNKM